MSCVFVINKINDCQAKILDIFLSNSESKWIDEMCQWKMGHWHMNSNLTLHCCCKTIHIYTKYWSNFYCYTIYSISNAIKSSIIVDLMINTRTVSHMMKTRSSIRQIKYVSPLICSFFCSNDGNTPNSARARGIKWHCVKQFTIFEFIIEFQISFIFHLTIKCQEQFWGMFWLFWVFLEKL